MLRRQRLKQGCSETIQHGPPGWNGWRPCGWRFGRLPIVHNATLCARHVWLNVLDSSPSDRRARFDEAVIAALALGRPAVLRGSAAETQLSAAPNPSRFAVSPDAGWTVRTAPVCMAAVDVR